MSSEYCIVMTTTETDTDAKSLARKLVEERLVACAQILSINSVFSWDGEVNETPEWLLLLKTRADIYERLESYLQEHHPYDVPEILRVEVDGGFGPYLNWMTENTVSA